MILSDSRILEEITKGTIKIEPYDRKDLGSNSYDVHLGKCTLVDDRLSAGFSGSLNDMRIKAFRTAAVYFDPSVFYTVRVNTFG